MSHRDNHTVEASLKGNLVENLQASEAYFSQVLAAKWCKNRLRICIKPQFGGGGGAGPLYVNKIDGAMLPLSVPFQQVVNNLHTAVDKPVKPNPWNTSWKVISFASSYQISYYLSPSIISKTE